jgi:uncharacterized protein YmfQ (DUF2313 family)
MLFPAELGGVFDADLVLEGSYLDAVKTSADNLVFELFADTCTAATIDIWERNYGLIPQVGDSLATRRNRVLTKIRAKGGITRAAFITLAAMLGYIITISEDSVDSPYSVCGITRCGFRMCSSGYLYQWTVNAAAPAKPDLEALINDMAPAHTQVLYHYT